MSVVQLLEKEYKHLKEKKKKYSIGVTEIYWKLFLKKRTVCNFLAKLNEESKILVSV